MTTADKRGGVALFPGSENSYVGHTMLCVAILAKPSHHMEVRISEVWVVLCLLPLRDWSSLNKPAGDVCLYGFT